LSSSAIVLAGGLSTRLGQDKGLLQLADKPLVRHVLDAINGLAEEAFVVVSSQAQAKEYMKIVNPDAQVLVDLSNMRSPLVGALTGFEHAQGRHSIVLAGDVPFVSRDVLSLMLEISIGKSAAIPRWPNGFIEPLQAVYSTELARQAAKDAINEGKNRMQAMVDKLQGVRYVSTLVLQQLDPELRTFFNVNTSLDLRKAEAMGRL
jgi:molybdopterin-guanine dinucleotide biosynthesis protein A